MTFWGNERGVSEILGAIMVFALVLSLLALVQINAVPAANEKIEFEHDQLVRSDMQNIRTAFIEASGSDEPRAASLDLGVQYPPRLFLINPGPSAGTLRTVDAPGGGEYVASVATNELDLAEICGTGDLGLKQLQYDVGYNVYRGDSVHTFENTVVVQNYRNSDSSLVQNGQVLVRGNTISLYILQGDVSLSGVNRESLTFIPGGTGTDTGTIGSAGSTWTLTVPTTVDDPDVWTSNDNLLADQLDPTDSAADKYVTGVTGGNDGEVDIQLEGGKEYTVRCTVVGLSDAPTNTPVDDIEEPEDGPEDVINPNAEGALVFKNSQVVDTADGTAVQITWENIATDGAIDVTHVRFPFYSADTQGNSGGDIPAAGDFDGADVIRGGGYTPYSSTVDSNGELTVDFQLYCDVGGTDVFSAGTGDYFALTLRYEYDGTIRSSTYFISPVSDLSGNNNRCTPVNAPTISDFDVTASNPNKDVDVTFESDEELNTISVTLSDDASGTLTRSDFTQTTQGNGNNQKFIYTADISEGASGTFTATLDVAEDADGNNGATGQTDSVTVN